MSERVLVLGAGGIGVLLAAKLSTGPRVEVVVAVRPGVAGLTFTVGGEDTTPSVALVTEPAEVDPVGWVIIATKTYDVATLEGWLTSRSCADATVVVAHAGIEPDPELSALAECGRVMPVLVGYAAESRAVGVSAQRLDGVVRVPNDEHGRAFAALAATTSLAVELIEDFEKAAWTKAAWDLVASSIGVIADVPLREIGRRPELQALAFSLVGEVRVLAERAGVRLDEGLAGEMTTTFAAYPKLVRPAMLQDRDAKRRFEHDSICGGLLRSAERRGVPMPVATAATQLLETLSPKPRSAKVLVPALPRVWCAPTADLSS
jgi:2-dehydropantoate 2-reductase